MLRQTIILVLLLVLYIWGMLLGAEKIDHAKGQEMPVTHSDIQQMAERIGFVYSVDPQVLLAVIRCESHYNQYAIGDQGRSAGLVQIHSKYHPEVTLKQALDPEFSIRFLARRIKEGYGKEWSCYPKLSTL